jgi:hypothetical protein
MLISPLERIWPFIWSYPNSLYSRMLCTKFDWNWQSSSGEEVFQKLSVILLFCFYLPLDRGFILHLNNSKSQVWLTLAYQWFWRRSRKCDSPADRHTNDRQRAIREVHFKISFQLRWAEKAVHNSFFFYEETQLLYNLWCCF